MHHAALALSLALCGAGSCAQSVLPVVPDVPATIGSASAVSLPLSLCTMDDFASLQSARASAGAASKQPVLLAWNIGEIPPGMAKVVAISSSSTAGCMPVQTLPAGGVEQMRLNVPYAVVDKAPDWSRGYTALVINMKNDDLPGADYLSRLKRHVRLVTTLFEPKGMDGYIVLAGARHEWAYLHWIDEDTAKRAFATPDGATGPRDSRSIQRALPQTLLTK
jgi:hypothetical protein